MLNITERAARQFQDVAAEGFFETGRLRVFMDHRCHCGKAHFSMALDENVRPGDEVFDVHQVPLIADAATYAELPAVEIDFVETVWTKGFTITNTAHDCRHHGMH
jgi:Fe-S cluster assembly iron-binding protein IscA